MSLNRPKQTTKANIKKDKEDEEEEKELPPVYMNITDIYPNGQVTILFSELFKSLEDQGYNITVFNLLKDLILNVTFVSQLNEKAKVRPSLEKW
jgi:hypothetical protein